MSYTLVRGDEIKQGDILQLFGAELKVERAVTSSRTRGYSGENLVELHLRPAKGGGSTRILYAEPMFTYDRKVVKPELETHVFYAEPGSYLGSSTLYYRSMLGFHRISYEGDGRFSTTDITRSELPEELVPLRAVEDAAS
jgi:hypothetical protein